MAVSPVPHNPAGAMPSAGIEQAQETSPVLLVPWHPRRPEEDPVAPIQTNSTSAADLSPLGDTPRAEPETLPRAFLKIEEAARILRISRSSAYEQAHVYLDSGGAGGLPVIRLGRSLRVPRHVIATLMATGSEPDAA